MTKPPMFIKTVQAGNERREDSWRNFCESITISKASCRERARAQLRLGDKGSWSIRASGVVEAGKRSPAEKSQRAAYSKAQSVTYVGPAKNYYPPAFGAASQSLISGIIGIAKPENIEVKRAFLCDASTVTRILYSKKTEFAAQEAYEHLIKTKKMFSSAEEIVNNKNTAKAIN